MLTDQRLILDFHGNDTNYKRGLLGKKHCFHFLHFSLAYTLFFLIRKSNFRAEAERCYNTCISVNRCGRGQET